MTYMAQQLRAYDPLESSRRIDPETGFPVILPDRRLDDFDPSTIFRRPPPNPSAGVRDDGMSANDLQRQLNRGTVAADNVADTEASITSLENERFTQPQPQPSGILASNRLAPSGPYGGSGLDPNIKKQRELEFLNQIYTQKNPNISGGLGGSNPSGMGGMGMGGFNFPVQATPTYQGGGFGPNVNNYSGAVSGVQSGYGTPQPAYGAASTLSNVQTPQTPYAGLNTANYTGYTNPAVQSTYAAQSPYGG